MVYEADLDILNRVHTSHIDINGCIRHACKAVLYPVLVKDIKEIILYCPIGESNHYDQQKDFLKPHEFQRDHREK